MARRWHGPMPSEATRAGDLPYRVRGESAGRWWVLLPALDPTEAACADTDSDVFFARSAGSYDVHHADDIKAARGMCIACPILASCQEWGIAHEHFSILGGLLPQEREAIREARGQLCVDPSGIGRVGAPDRSYFPELQGPAAGLRVNDEHVEPLDHPWDEPRCDVCSSQPDDSAWCAGCGCCKVHCQDFVDCEEAVA